MTPDLALILTATAAAAYGTWAVGNCRDVPVWLRGLAILCVALAGVNTITWAALTGDGRVLPGYQLHPFHVDTLGKSGAITAPWLWIVIAVSGHLLVWIPKPRYWSFFLPLPATLCFVVLLLIINGRPDEKAITIEWAVGPHADAFLTLVPSGDDVRLVVAHGRRDETLLDVLHVHKAKGWPGKPRIEWTADGHVVAVSFNRQRIFALTLDGETTGWLPTKASDWPRETKTAESAEALIRHSEARMNVDRLVQRHGKIYVPKRPPSD